MYSCGAGRSTLGIEADGSIKGCPSLPTEAWVGGNIRDHSLKDIWERAEPLRYTRDRTVEDLWGYCRTCYYADECRAGCTWTGFVLFGKAGNNPYCHHRALEMQREGKRERVVKVEEAPGLPFDHGKFDVVVEDIPAPATSPSESPST
jgi:radical SAM protein with 4Fe4S-binding SPASM domain